MELKDWLNSINHTKELPEDPQDIKSYPPFIVNKCLSGTLDSVLFANEMNKNPHLEKQLQYDFLRNSLRKKKRFAPWLKSEKIKDLEAVKKYYNYSHAKAEQVMRILTRKQIEYIKQKLDTGGRL
tara:strand:+ start:3717 stop:4091 length:375 start_codon:yes stop_codon:yes gene_type:complete